MTIASLVIDIAANTATLQRDVEQVNTKMDTIVGSAGKIASALGIAFSVGAVVSFAKEMLTFASNMEDVSAKTGIGVEQLQALAYAASGAGVSVDQIASAVSQLGKRLVNGDDGAVAAVQSLGLNVAELIAMNPADAFLAIADRVAGIENPMQAAATAMALFGRSGAELLPAMKEDLRALMDQAQRTGAVIDQDMIKRADALDDAIGHGVITLKAWAFHIIEMGHAVEQTISPMHILMGQMSDIGAMAGFTGNMDSVIERLTRAKEGTNAFVPAIDSLAMSTYALGQADKAVAADTAKATKAREDQTKAVEAAQKAADNWARLVGGLEIEALLKSEAALEENAEAVKAWEQMMIRSEASVQHWYQVYEQQVQDAARATEKWEQDVAEAMIRNENSMLAHTMTIGDLWNSLGDSMSHRTQALMLDIGDALGPKFSRIAEGMVGAWENGKSLMKGIGEIMKGDFSNLVGTIIAGVELIKSAWGAISGLFGQGGEHANDTRDNFLNQFGGGGGLAALLTSLGAGDGGGGLYQALIGAADVAGVNAAKAAVEQFLHDHGVPGFAMGSGGFQNFGSGTLAMLHGDERVQTKAQAESEGGWSSRIASGIDALNANMARWNEQMPLVIRDQSMLARGRA